MREPSVLILDEFSSALDPATEASILRTIDALRGGCTIISIAHRLAVARSADRIFVMREGSVVETGAHEQLVAAGGVYADLWRNAGGDRRGRDESAHTEAIGPELGVTEIK